jgi:DNA mismatch repair protein MutS
VEGIANSSYGLNVARMAGIGRDVVTPARTFQKQHFAEYDFISVQPDLFSAINEDSPQHIYYDESEQEALHRLRSFSIEQSSPLEALLFLKGLQEMLQAK